MAEPILETVALTVRYGGVVANDEVALAIGAGQIVGLIGPNGAGKSTFADAVTGYVAYHGSVRFAGAPVDGLAPHQRARRGLVRTWQSIELFGDLTVAENLAVAVRPGTWRDVLADVVRPGRPADLAPALDALDRVGLAEVADRYPAELSLGTERLVGVARALATGPRVIVLDEPAAGLSPAETRALGDRLRAIAGGGIAVLLIDHDMDLVLDVCERVHVLSFGRTIAEGTPAEVRRHPAVLDAYLGAAPTEAE